MTNEEAIKVLNDPTFMWDLWRVEQEEAIEVATKALKQPDIIRCSDCKWLQCNIRPDGTLPKGVDEFECRHWCGACDPTDFCSYAERSEHGSSNLYTG